MDPAAVQQVRRLASYLAGLSWAKAPYDFFPESGIVHHLHHCPASQSDGQAAWRLLRQALQSCGLHQEAVSRNLMHRLVRALDKQNKVQSKHSLIPSKHPKPPKRPMAVPAAAFRTVRLPGPPLPLAPSTPWTTPGPSPPGPFPFGPRPN
eukprot:EG_transcript_40789